MRFSEVYILFPQRRKGTRQIRVLNMIMLSKFFGKGADMDGAWTYCLFLEINSGGGSCEWSGGWSGWSRGVRDGVLAGDYGAVLETC